MTNAQVKRRLYPGSSAESAFVWPLVPLEDLESSFSIQEHLQQLIRANKDDTQQLVALPDNVDPEVWKFEHLRQICLELSQLVVRLETECTIEQCPEMKTEGWLYLCAAHATPQSCPAIDYTIHTLDSATTLLNSSRHFPSRISIPESSLKQFQSISRRLYRIFSHAYFHHREAYEFFENDTALYSRFLKLSRQYNLIPRDLVTIPDNEDGNSVENPQDKEPVHVTGSMIKSNSSIK